MAKPDNTTVYTSPYELDGRIPLRQAIPLGLQHVMAMFVGNLTPLLSIMAICGITLQDYAALRISLLQNAMLIAGLITLVQLYPIWRVGARLPIVMGTSSGFIGMNNSIATSMMAGVAAGTITTNVEAGIYAYGAVMGACLIGGLWEGALGFFIKPLRKFFPPVVTGTVVMAIGLSLLNVGINFFGGGNSNADFGSTTNLLLGLFVLIVIICLKYFCKGFISQTAILLGIIAGYIAATIMGFILPTTGVTADGTAYTYSWVVQWSEVADASWFAIPKLFPVKLQFNISAILPMLVMFIVTAVETVGDTAGVTEGGLGREPTGRELSGAVICDGIGSSFAALFGVLPNTSFSQNVGLVGITKVVNRFAIACGAVFLVLCGLLPKVGAIVSIMPQSVLGGAAVMMFASIVVSGVNLITKEPLTGRNATIVAIALGLGYGIGAHSTALQYMPSFISNLFGESGIVPACLVAVILNLALPKDKEQLEP
ncbi:MAG: purine permease [Oscillospiraceae bacterium]|nr:purine permease [Oscillospiraceae bacterium]